MDENVQRVARGCFGFSVLNYGPPAMAVRACRSIARHAPGAALVLVDNFSTADNAALARAGLAALRQEMPGPYFFKSPCV